MTRDRSGDIGNAIAFPAREIASSTKVLLSQRPSKPGRMPESRVSYNATSGVIR
ncbi:hypothetical protein EYZ11_003940 [Aspergillus tanneri]|uniref:Uncharacterized protein n=1 Tax=Aspergillus tanneri TaxID=1220188 RepID=A0A4S3JMF3_9EURO|nr:hypothetical protein EYZ11_003940 [Aspergillus tanneri]